MDPEELDEGLPDDLERAVHVPMDGPREERQLAAGGEHEVTLSPFCNVPDEEVLGDVVGVQVKIQGRRVGGSGVLAVAVDASLHQAGLGDDGCRVRGFHLPDGRLHQLPRGSEHVVPLDNSLLQLEKSERYIYIYVIVLHDIEIKCNICH